MPRSKTRKIWHNGEFIDWDKASIHVMSHGLQYGIAWFEGIRCYNTSRGPEVFRLREHVERLRNSCRIYRTEIPYTCQEMQTAILETIRVNVLEACYIRPLVCRGSGPFGIDPLATPIETFVMAGELGPYLGENALEDGIDVCVANWARAAPNTFPAMAKVAGNYCNSALMKMNAVLNGFTEAIALDTRGYVSEGITENIFLVWRSKLLTPPLSDAILPGITRDSVMTLARECGYEVVEQSIPREMLYIAEEIFLTGTAAEITPVRSVDRVVVGKGKRGPITGSIQKHFFDYVEGKAEDRHVWMSPVYSKGRVTSV